MDTEAQIRLHLLQMANAKARTPEEALVCAEQMYAFVKWGAMAGWTEEDVELAHADTAGSA